MSSQFLRASDLQTLQLVFGLETPHQFISYNMCTNTSTRPSGVLHVTHPCVMGLCKSSSFGGFCVELRIKNPILLIVQIGLNMCCVCFGQSLEKRSHRF